MRAHVYMGRGTKHEERAGRGDGGAIAGHGLLIRIGDAGAKVEGAVGTCGTSSEERALGASGRSFAGGVWHSRQLGSLKERPGENGLQ